MKNQVRELEYGIGKTSFQYYFQTKFKSLSCIEE